MIDLVERYLARAWLGTPALAPTMQSYSQLASMLGREDFIPMPFQEIALGGLAVGRVGLMSPDGVWRVLVRAESIDLEYRPIINQAPARFADFLSEAGVFLSKAGATFDRNASRIAGVQEVFLRDVGEGAMTEAARRLLHLSPTFEGGMFEWDWRVCSKVTRTVGAHTEAGNTIVVVKRSAGLMDSQPFDRIRISTDVNTEPSDLRSRFGPADIRTFFSESVTWHDALIAEVLQLMNLS